MQTTVTIALFALCACLACWIIALEWGMREARKRLQQHLKNETTVRLDVPCASRGAFPVSPSPTKASTTPLSPATPPLRSAPPAASPPPTAFPATVTPPSRSSGTVPLPAG